MSGIAVETMAVGYKCQLVGYGTGQKEHNFGSQNLEVQVLYSCLLPFQPLASLSFIYDVAFS